MSPVCSAAQDEFPRLMTTNTAVLGDLSPSWTHANNMPALPAASLTGKEILGSALFAWSGDPARRRALQVERE